MSILTKNSDLTKVYNEYFFWFSHFEYALKLNKYLKQGRNGKKKAEADWDDFVNIYYLKYDLSDNAKELIKLNPKKQVVDINDDLIWEELVLANYKCGQTKISDLCTVITMLKTVRNNLFHGGKHDRSLLIERNNKLIKTCIKVLSELSLLAEFGEDYPSHY